MQTIDTPTTNAPSTSTLPDGTALANDIIASAGKRDTAALLRKTSKGATPAKVRQGEPPAIRFEPRGWTMGGRVD